MTNPHSVQPARTSRRSSRRSCSRATGCVILLLEAFAPALRRWFATLALAGIGGLALRARGRPMGTTFGGRFETSPLTLLDRPLPRRLRRPGDPRRQAVPRTRGRREGRVLRPAPLGPPRRLAHDARTRPARRLHRPRDAVAVLLRPRGLLPRRRGLLRGRAEVLPDGGLRLGVHALRRRAPLRRERRHEDRRPRAGRPRVQPVRRLRPSAPARRVRLQDVARAVPRLGARRLPGDADARPSLYLSVAPKGGERPRPLPGLRGGLRVGNAGPLPHRRSRRSRSSR